MNVSYLDKETLSELYKITEIISKRYNFLALKKTQKDKLSKEAINKISNNIPVIQINTIYKEKLEEEYKNALKIILNSAEILNLIKKNNLSLLEIIKIYIDNKITINEEIAALILNSFNDIKNELKEYIKDLKIEEINNETILIFIRIYSNIENENSIAEAKNDKEANDYDGLRILLQTTLKEDLLSKEEEASLFQKMQNGDNKAREKLILSNIRLVVSLAKKYKTIPLEDAIEEGISGLIIAIDKFDISKNSRLSTYAQNWIIAKIQRAVLSNPVIKQPSITTEEKKNDNLNIISLNSKINDDDDNELIDYIPDKSIDFVQKIEDEQLIEYIIKELRKNGIKKELINIFILRIGAKNKEPKTYYEIAKLYNTTEQNIRAKLQSLLPKINEIRSDEYNGILKVNINKNILIFKSKIKKIYPYVQNDLSGSDLLLLKKLDANRIEDMKKVEVDYIISTLIPRVSIILSKKMPEKPSEVKYLTIFEIMSKYGCDEELVLKAYNYLPTNMQEIIKKRNGLSLKEHVPTKEYTIKDNTVFKHKIVRCLKIICRSIINELPIDESIFQTQEPKIRKRQTIKEKLGQITDEEYEWLLDTINSQDKELIELNDTKTLRLTKKNKIDINCSLMPKLKRKINKYRGK